MIRRIIRRIRRALGLPCRDARPRRRANPYARAGQYTIIDRDGIAHVVPRRGAR